MTSAAKRDRQGQSPSLYRLKELFTAAPISQRRPPGLPTPSSLLTHNPSISRWCIPLSYLSYTQYVQFNPELGNVCKGTVIRFLVHTSYRNCIFLSSFFRLVLMAFCVVGNGGHRRWLGYPRSGWLFYSPYQNEWADDPTGMGLLYYGQNFLIYPSAFPAGARESEHLSPTPHSRRWLRMRPLPTQTCPSQPTFPSRTSTSSSRPRMTSRSRPSYYFSGQYWTWARRQSIRTENCRRTSRYAVLNSFGWECSPPSFAVRGCATDGAHVPWQWRESRTSHPTGQDILWQDALQRHYAIISRVCVFLYVLWPSPSLLTFPSVAMATLKARRPKRVRRQGPPLCIAMLRRLNVCTQVCK